MIIQLSFVKKHVTWQGKAHPIQLPACGASALSDELAFFFFLVANQDVVETNWLKLISCVCMKLPLMHCSTTSSKRRELHGGGANIRPIPFEGSHIVCTPL